MIRHIAALRRHNVKDAAGHKAGLPGYDGLPAPPELEEELKRIADNSSCIGAQQRHDAEMLFLRRTTNTRERQDGTPARLVREGVERAATEGQPCCSAIRPPPRLPAEPSATPLPTQCRQRRATCQLLRYGWRQQGGRGRDKRRVRGKAKMAITFACGSTVACAPLHAAARRWVRGGIAAAASAPSSFTAADTG